MTAPIDLIYDRHVADEKLKAGTKYERLAALVFKRLHEQGVVVHDLRLRGDGKKAVHQIDVTVERSGCTRRLLVECRDREPGNKIEQGDVRDFNGALVQLDADGIMVTTEGYTRGAVDYADDEGITLAVMRGFRDDEDWEGRLRKIEIEISIFVPDTESIRARLLVATPDADTSFTGGVDPNEIAVQSQDGMPAGSLADLVRAALDKVPTGTTGHVVSTYDADPPLLVQLNSGPAVSVRGVEVEADILELTEHVTVDAGDRVATLILETIDGQINRVFFDTDLRRFRFDSDGNVLPR